MVVTNVDGTIESTVDFQAEAEADEGAGAEGEGNLTIDLGG